MLLPDEEGWYLYRRARPTEDGAFVMQGGVDRATLDELRI